MAVDMEYHGQPRKLILQGNRNGFFYVLDRTNGKFLAASPFVKRLTWASGIGTDGRPFAVIQDLTRSTTYYQGKPPFPPPAGLAHPYAVPVNNLTVNAGSSVLIIP